MSLRFLLVPILAAVIGCGSSASTNVTAPASTRCEAAITNSAGAFPAVGGTGSISVSVSRDCTWRAASPPTWIAFTSTAEGQGDGTFSYRVLENADPLQRQAALVVAERQVSITQAAAECRYELNGLPPSIASTGVQAELSLATHQACSWTARVNEAWGDVTPSSGKGPAVLRLSVAANTGAERSVSLSIGNERVTAVQEPLPTIPAPVPTPTPPTPVPPTPVPPTPVPPTPVPPTPVPPTPVPPTPVPPTPVPPTPVPPTPVPPTPTPPPPTPTPPPPTPTPPPPSPPTPVREITIDGEVSNVSGTCPALTFTLDGRTVVTNNQTEFSKGPCKNLKKGVEVEVRGTLMSDGRVQAARVRFEDD